MFGSGVAIGKALIVRPTRRTLRDLRGVAIAWSAVVVGTTALGSVVCRIVATTIRRTATATWAFALFAFHNKTTSF